MNPLDRIAAARAMPITHRVVTLYDDGRTYVHDTRGRAQAENWAVGERRKIGKRLIDRMTGNAATVTAVVIEEV